MVLIAFWLPASSPFLIVLDLTTSVLPWHVCWLVVPPWLWVRWLTALKTLIVCFSGLWRCLCWNSGWQINHHQRSNSPNSRCCDLDCFRVPARTAICFSVCQERCLMTDIHSLLFYFFSSIDETSVGPPISTSWNVYLLTFFFTESKTNWSFMCVVL